MQRVSSRPWCGAGRSAQHSGCATPAAARGALALAALAGALVAQPAPRAARPPVARPAATSSTPAVELRLHHLQMLGTHNSYHVAPPRTLIAPWAYTHAPLGEQVERHGVRQVELDVHVVPGEPFAVYHVPGIDAGTTCATLTACLGELKRWSDRRRAHHHPLFVFVEPKDDFDRDKFDAAQYVALEREVESVWPRTRVLTPDDVRGDAATLRDAILERGWPSLRACRGKAIFVMLDTGAHRRAYSKDRPSLEGRLMFVTSAPDRPDAAIFKYDDPVRHAARIRAAVDAGFLVRTRADVEGREPRRNDRRRLEAALASGAHIISTDFPAPNEHGYVARIPGGTPSRPNPRTAPEGARAEDLEPTRR